MLRPGWKVVFASLILVQLAQADGKVVCLYATADGTMRQVNSLGQVPAAYKKTAKCFSAESARAESGAQALAQPEEIELSGTIRREDMASSVGRIDLRWPRKVELLFGRTPQRAMADAAMTVSRTLKSSGFPLKLQKLDLDWKVVFMDEDLPEAQIPGYLVSNCHPAWMTPPANIYVVAQRVVAGCSGDKQVDRRTSDAQLATVLIHEMGHAVEFQLLDGFSDGDRMRAEGFASWFEQHAANYSMLVEKARTKELFQHLTRESLKKNPDTFYFSGTAHDYARASMYFSAIVARRNVRTLMDVYEYMLKKKVSFFDAIDQKLNWPRPRLEAEVRRVVNE